MAPGDFFKYLFFGSASYADDSFSFSVGGVRAISRGIGESAKPTV